MPDRKTAIDSDGVYRGRQLLLLASVVFVAGIVIIIVAALHQQHAADPKPSSWGTVSSNAPSALPPTPAYKPTAPRTTVSSAGPMARNSAPSPTRHAALPASKPVHISIPAIAVDSKVFAIGKDPHGGLQVPQPGPDLNNVAWYKDSPTPGQTGPAVLEGHVDTIHGPSVFLRLGALTPGNKIKIARADGTTVVFTVNAVRAYQSHGAFPTELVYGGNLATPTLRIITCSNFDHATGHYVGNTIIFAHLTSSHH